MNVFPFYFTGGSSGYCHGMCLASSELTCYVFTKFDCELVCGRYSHMNWSTGVGFTYVGYLDVVFAHKNKFTMICLFYLWEPCDSLVGRAPVERLPIQVQAWVLAGHVNTYQMGLVLPSLKAEAKGTVFSLV